MLRLTRMGRLAMFAVTATFVAAGLLIPTPARAQTGGYPYANYNCPGSNAAAYQWTDTSGKMFSGYGFAYRNCTDFTAWKLNTTNQLAFRNDTPHGRYGNADTWALTARANGYIVDMNPAVGAVAWWNANAHGMSKYGHVAWVSAVSGDKVTIQEYNNPGGGTWGTRTFAKDKVSGYIHFKDLSAGTTTTTPAIPHPDHNHDIWPDMYAINKRDPGSGRTTHYVLDGRDPAHVLQAGGSPFGWTDQSWSFSISHDWSGDHTPDIVAVNKRDAGSGRTVYYVLNGVNPEHVIQVGRTPFGWTDHNWIFKVGPDHNADGRPEIYAFNRQDPSTGRSVMYILHGVNPEVILLVSRLPFGYTDANWDFAPGPDFNADAKPDIYAFNKRDPGTAKTAHYVLSGANPEHMLQAGGSFFGWLDARWSLFPGRDRNGDGKPDLYAVNRHDPGTGKTVFYVLDGAGPERLLIVGALPFGYTDEFWDFGVW